MVFLLLFLFYAHAADSPIAVYERNRHDYMEKEVQNRNVLSQLYDMQQNIKRINLEKTKLLVKKDNTEKHIQKLNPLVKIGEEKILAQKIEIQKRLLYILKFQDMSILKVVFSNQTPSGLDRNLRILKNLTDRDYVLLKSYFKNMRTLKTKQAELIAKKASLLALEQQISDKEVELKNRSEKKNKMLSDINDQKTRLLTKLQEIRSKRLQKQNRVSRYDLKREEFLSTLFEPLFFERKGKLPRPIQGVIVQNYGYFLHPKYKTQIRHKGLFYGTSALAEIKAVAKGRVVHLEKSKGSGYTMVIDHSDHYYSVYSYVNEPTVKLNDEVQEGQVLAHAVQIHPFFGEGLYFEMRHFSEPVDPIAWFEPASNEATRRIR